MTWRRVLRTWLIGLVVIAGLMVLSFYGFRLWIQYANSDLFKGEVNAAIITGLVGIVTLVGTMGFTAYFNYRSYRLTIRDELFKKRMEVYHQIFDYAWDLLDLVYDFLNEPNEINKEKIMQHEKIMLKYVRNNRFSLSDDIFHLSIQLGSRANWLIRAGLGWANINELLKELSLNKEIIVVPREIGNRFHEEYFMPLLQQFQKELGLKSIEKELQILRT